MLTENGPLHLSNYLEDFLYYQKFPVTIKEVSSGRYTFCNQAVAERDGILITNYVKMTAYDIADLMHYKASVPEHAAKMDTHIAKCIRAYAKYNQVIPIHNKDIYVEEIVKKPIIGKNNNIIAILTHSREITSYVDPLYLFSLYRQYYPTKQAIQYFLRFMELNEAFHQLPTKRELMTLLAMRKTANAKYIARELNLSPRTVDENKSRIRDKLKIITLNELLIQLRIRNELLSMIK